jgi:peptidylprolyl isomerase
VPAFLLLLAGCLSAPPSPAGLPEGPPPLPPESHDAIRFGTDLGPFTVILYESAAPETVALMRAYVEEGYFVGRAFHRIVPGHVIQVTDAAGGATEDARRVPLEASPDHVFSAGAVGIARGLEPDSGGPEFFVMDFATSHLNGNYTVWGQVVEGLHVVHRIARGPAIDFRRTLAPFPPEVQDAAPTDRMATDPVAIRSTELVRVQVPGGVYPLQVATNVRAGDHRHSLEWPRLLRPDVTADLAWYVRPYNGTAPPAPRDVQVRIAGELLPVLGEATAEGVYRFRWTPTDLAERDVTLVAHGADLATLRLRPRAAP